MNRLPRFLAELKRFRAPSWLVEGRPWMGWILLACLALGLLSGIATVVLGLVVVWLVASHGAGELKGNLHIALLWITGIFAGIGITFFRLWWNYGREGVSGNLPRDLKAAQAGDGAAAHRVGLHYVATDPASARAWLLRAAQTGVPEAMVDLALMLKEGRGGHRDLNAARTWLQRAAQAGHPQAAALLVHVEECLGDTYSQRGN